MAEIHDAFEPLRYGKLQHRPGRCIVNDQRVEFVTVLEASDLSEELSAALCGKEKCLGEGERPLGIIDKSPAEL